MPHHLVSRIDGQRWMLDISGSSSLLPLSVDAGHFWLLISPVIVNGCWTFLAPRLSCHCQWMLDISGSSPFPWVLVDAIAGFSPFPISLSVTMDAGHFWLLVFPVDIGMVFLAHWSLSSWLSWFLTYNVQAGFQHPSQTIQKLYVITLQVLLSSRVAMLGLWPLLHISISILNLPFFINMLSYICTHQMQFIVICGLTKHGFNWLR